MCRRPRRGPSGPPSPGRCPCRLGVLVDQRRPGRRSRSALHRRSRSVVRRRASRRASPRRQPTSRAVGARVVATPGCPSPRRCRTRAHRAGDDPEIARPSPDRTLAGDPHVLAAVVLALGEVVVAVDALRHRRTLADRSRPHSRPSTASSIWPRLLERVLLRPEQVVDVGVELRRPLEQVGQVRVRQVEEPLLHQALGALDVDAWPAGCRCPASPSAGRPRRGRARRGRPRTKWLPRAEGAELADGVSSLLCGQLGA